MEGRPLRRDILLTVPDRQSRTLLLAELEEAGYEVMGVPGLRYAERILAQGAMEPRLVLLDVYDDDQLKPQKDQALTALGGQAP